MKSVDNKRLTADAQVIIEISKETYMIYKIRLEETDEGFAILVPELPGCWSQGETEAEAIENIKDAIQTYLETIERISLKF